jgi:tRNA(fMet)-specific endonuclease VapC
LRNQLTLRTVPFVQSWAGKPIGANALLIAAQALTLGYTVVTNNEKEFSRVKQLNVENWLR